MIIASPFFANVAPIGGNRYTPVPFIFSNKNTDIPLPRHFTSFKLLTLCTKFEAGARAKTDNGPDVSMEISACFCWYHVS